MALARNTSQKNRREAEKGERVRALRNAPETTTMAAAAAVTGHFIDVRELIQGSAA